MNDEPPLRERRKLQSEHLRPRTSKKKPRPFGLRITRHYTTSFKLFREWSYTEWYATDRARAEARRAFVKSLSPMYESVEFEELSR